MKLSITLSRFVCVGSLGFLTACSSSSSTPSNIEKKEVRLCGASQEISPTDSNVVEIAQAAAKEKGVELIKVIKASTQVVAGINYHLILEVKKDSEIKRIRTSIWVKSWENFQKITLWVDEESY